MHQYQHVLNDRISKFSFSISLAFNNNIIVYSQEMSNNTSENSIQNDPAITTRNSQDKSEKEMRNEKIVREFHNIALFYDYQNNLKQYPTWHEYFRINQPPTLVAWGKNDIFFGPNGALAFQKDLKDVEVHLLNTGHFPLEEDLDVSASLIKRFLGERIK
jgi:pimeloyl-ACP methyl ester carboxylesterase